MPEARRTLEIRLTTAISLLPIGRLGLELDLSAVSCVLRRFKSAFPLRRLAMSLSKLFFSSTNKAEALARCSLPDFY